MITTIKQLLTPAQLQAINQLIDQGQFEDGKLTAGWHAKNVKHNRQWQANTELSDELNHSLGQALGRNPEFTAAAYPKLLQPFLISESSDGGHYGPHVDDALMGLDQIARSDISCTIFLSDASSYQGGELLMGYQGNELSFKLNAGDAIIYPSTTLHQVTAVSQGQRRVAVSWIESYIRNAGQREILYDLDQARKDIMGRDGKSDSFDRISKSHANLLRMWAET